MKAEESEGHAGEARLEALFRPGSVAVIGASREENKIGHAVLSNLLESGFGGRVYPINPKADEILGLRCYPDLKAIEEKVDLVVIVIPAQAVLDSIEACARARAKSVIVITAGFRETGREGLQAERRMTGIARKHGMRILGPNCLGLIDTGTPANLSFAAGMPRSGRIAFMSQSGALCTSILDIALAQEVGFSRFVSLGNKADLTEIDFLEAWSDDPESGVIMAYLEGITDGNRFVDVARRLTKKKPVIAIKSGTTGAGAKAVSSHTGTLAGSDRAYEAAFKQAGVIRAGSIDDLFDFATAMARQPLPRNDRVAVVTNAGGPGIMASDAIERTGLGLADLGNETMAELRKILPSAASVSNPVDLLGDARADRYRDCLERVGGANGVGAMIVILTPQFMTQVEETAVAVGEAARRLDKPVLACFMGEAHTTEGVRKLTEYNIPNYVSPERAVAALRRMFDQHQWQEAALPAVEEMPGDRGRVRKLFEQVRSEGRVQMGDAETLQLLEAYGIPLPASRLCESAKEAVGFAEEVGYPVVMKIASPDILHKTDIGGVRLGIDKASAVEDAFDLLTLRARRYMEDAELWGCIVQRQVKRGKEVIIGMNRDPQFGPLVMFGLGGVYVEVLKDVAFRIAPFSREDARKLVREIRSFALLKGVRGEAASDIDAIVDTLLKVSQLVTDFPEIVELDINPLVVFDEGQGAAAIDGRLVLRSS